MYDLTYMYNLGKPKNYRKKKDCSCPEKGVVEVEEKGDDGQKVQSSSCKICKFGGYNIQHGDYG